jgi:hypothetical protein
MRIINVDATALLGTKYPFAMFLELQLTIPTYLATCRDSIDWNGHTWIGGKALGVDEISEQSGEVVGLRYSLSGVPSDMISIALSEPIKGKAAIAYLAIMYPDTQAIADVFQIWSGTLDQMPVTEQDESATVSVSAEHLGISFARPKGIMYSDAEQQRLYPGDRCLEFLASQAQHQDVWPAASFFRQ